MQKRVHKKTEIINLLVKGLQNWQIAHRVGCSESYVRQLELTFRRPLKRRKPPATYERFLHAKEVEERWGLPIKQLIQDLVDQGFSLRKASLVLGCSRETVRINAKGIVLPPKEL